MSSSKMRMEYATEEQTLIGSRRRCLVDKDTGEVIEVTQITKRRYGQKNFWKCYLMDFLSILGVFDSKQVDVFIYIVENTNASTNVFLGTYRHISENTGVSQPTISSIMKKLQQHGFIKKIQNGAWFVNPDILMKGSDQKKEILLRYYNDEEPIEAINNSRSKIKGQLRIIDPDCKIEEEE